VQNVFVQPRIDRGLPRITAVGDMVFLRELTGGRLDPCMLHAIHIDVVSHWLPTRFAARHGAPYLKRVTLQKSNALPFFAA
jgi:hypothetical protein